MSSLRKMAQLLAMLACVGLSMWAIGCGDPNKTGGTTDKTTTDDATTDTNGATLDETTTDDTDADMAGANTTGSDEAGSGTSDGGAGGIDVPEPASDSETPTESE